MSINDRIKKIRKAASKTQEAFGDCLGVSKTTVFNWEQAGGVVPARNIKAISGIFGVREEWLRSGTGDMYEKAGKTDVLKFVEQYQRLSPAFQKLVRTIMAELQRTQEESAIQDG